VNFLQTIKARHHAWWLALPMALLPITAVEAQQFESLVRGKEQSRLDGRLQAGRAAWWDARDDSGLDEGIDLRIVASVAYDDNIFLSADQPESDVVLLFSPRIAYTVGERKGTDGGFAAAAYQPALVFYVDQANSNRADHALDLAAGWRGKTTVLGYDGKFRSLSDTTADAGTPADRLEFDHAIRLAWQPREKIAVAGAAAFAGVLYDQPGFFDSRTYSAEGSLNYIHSPKTQLGLVLRMIREEVDQSGDQTARQVLVRFAWQPREKIGMDLAAGLEYRNTDLGSATEPVLDGRVVWQPRQGTDLYLAGFIREEASGFFSGQNYRIRNLTAGVAQALGGGWTARLETGLERSTYVRVSGQGPADRVDRVLFVQPSVEYSPRENLRLGVFHRFADSDSNQSGFGYRNHQTGVTLQYDF
jgi:hypothetical protein